MKRMGSRQEGKRVGGEKERESEREKERDKKQLKRKKPQRIALTKQKLPILEKTSWTLFEYFKMVVVRTGSSIIHFCNYFRH